MHSSTHLIIIPFICFICYCILLTVLLGSRKKNKIAKYYIFYIIAMIVWSFASFIMRTNVYPGPLFWNRILCVGLISMPVIFYHFTLVLTETTTQKNKLYFGYYTAGILIICNFVGMIMRKAYVVNNIFYYVLGPVASVMAIWSLGYMLLAFSNILYKVKKGEMPFNRVRLILFGIVLVLVGGLLNLLPSLGKYPIDIISNTINAVFIAYSIYRYKFLKIKLIVKKGIAYSLYTLILTGLYIITVFVVEEIMSSIIGYSTIASALIIAVLLGFVFQPVKNTIQKGIDRFFYKDKLNHQVLLRDFSKITNNILDLEELTDSLLKVVEQGLKPKKISLILRKGKEEYSFFRCSDNNIYMDELKYSINHPIVKWFMEGNLLLTMEQIERLPLFTILWSVEKEQLYKMETELIVPIKLREQLIGILVLSEKKNGETYLQEEMDLLFTLMNNAAVVIDNGKMYENLKHQAITDGLTKLYNHRYFHEILGKYNNEYIDKRFSVAMIDVDLFKVYNDIYGHSAGDKALIKIAKIIKQSVRKEDLVARYGGEEFAVLFPNIEEEKALEIIEKIRKEIENSFIFSTEINEFITVSAGVASLSDNREKAEVILEYADTVMYVAKRRGRNQSVLYSKNENKRCEANKSEMEEKINSAYFSTVYALAATIDAKDHYTYGHSENVSKYAVTLAKAAGFDKEKIEIVKNAGLLHDIGKIGIPENILTKKERLTPEEYEIMKKHVDISITIIKHIPNLIKVIPAIMSHHEKYDGTGYPRGISGENIPIEGRCLGIVDAFDAMTTNRSYRKALSPEQAIMELKKHSGTQFDTKLTQLFIQLYEEGKIEMCNCEDDE
ncbi:diguanylate cyclase [Clostridium sp. ZS2-4]|uniref:diguanylate cyclase n=1 Tax=Clostridium sp. ZS2-4 TaxID=2987703 RepID=UPI00227D2846|nr:diguanylate cyclase [Clostridium sp. ZS2-4]MCY6355173.1 diguanylate cyclase [Clostridium sp. ZS2-4]